MLSAVITVENVVKNDEQNSAKYHKANSLATGNTYQILRCNKRKSRSLVEDIIRTYSCSYRSNISSCNFLQAYMYAQPFWRGILHSFCLIYLVIERPIAALGNSLALATFYIGKRIPPIKIFIAPIFICFLPLSLWIWDISFTNRFIYNYFHYDKLIFLDNYPVKTRYFYIFGTALYLLFLIYAIYIKKRDSHQNIEIIKG